MNEVGRDQGSPRELGAELKWSKLTGPDAVKVIDHDWVRYLRVAILLAAVILTWRIMFWQESNYDAAAARAAVAARADRFRTPPAVSGSAQPLDLPTVRAPAPTISIPPPGSTTPNAGESTPRQSTLPARAPAGAPTEYVVKAGDTLGAIADSVPVPLDALMQLNNITDPNQIRVGQVLKIPNPSRFVPGGQKPETYAVAEGDTLAGIAARFGVDQEELRRLNAIEDADSIVVGSVLRIP